jgi:hypothetical protein
MAEETAPRMLQPSLHTLIGESGFHRAWEREHAFCKPPRLRTSEKRAAISTSTEQGTELVGRVNIYFFRSKTPKSQTLIVKI